MTVREIEFATESARRLQILQRTTLIGGNLHRKLILMGMSEAQGSQADLPQVAQAAYLLRFGFSSLQGGKQHGGQQRDNGNHTEHFDQGHSALVAVIHPGSRTAAHACFLYPFDRIVNM